MEIHNNLRAPRLLPGGTYAAGTRIKGSKKAEAGFLFVSGAVYRRVPVFRRRKACEIFLRSLESYRRKFGFRVHAYALIPDHYHLLVWFPPQLRLVDFLRDFKSWVGRRIILYLRQESGDGVLSRLELKRKRQRGRDPQYCVLQYNSFVKVLIGARMIRQKLTYIHANPVREGLAATPEAYPYSSARAYGGKGLSLVKIDRLDFS